MELSDEHRKHTNTSKLVSKHRYIKYSIDKHYTCDATLSQFQRTTCVNLKSRCFTYVSGKFILTLQFLVVFTKHFVCIQLFYENTLCYWLIYTDVSALICFCLRTDATSLLKCDFIL